MDKGKTSRIISGGGYHKNGKRYQWSKIHTPQTEITDDDWMEYGMPDDENNNVSNESRNMKRTVRLTESELRNMIAESVKRVLNESKITKVNHNQPSRTFTQDEEDKLRNILKKNKNIDEAFEDDFNAARDKHIGRGGMFGMELKNSEGEWQYGDVTYDPNTNTMSCMGVSIEVDPDMSIDQNLEGLYEELMNNGFSDGDE